MASRKMNPPRRRTKEQERADNRKQLAAKRVSGTVDIETILEETNGTDKIKPIEQAPIIMPAEPTRDGQRLKKTHYTIAIIGGIIGILIVVAVVVANYTSLKEGLNNTNFNLKELKQSINERIGRLEERMDKYVTRDKSK